MIRIHEKTIKLKGVLLSMKFFWLKHKAKNAMLKLLEFQFTDKVNYNANWIFSIKFNFLETPFS